MSHSAPFTRAFLMDEFFANVRETATCWLWTGYLHRDGYGIFSRGKALCQSIQAHRFAFEIYNGKVGENLCVDHICCVRSCVNPQHLRAVTHRENVLAGVSAPAKNARKLCCQKCGGPYTQVTPKERRCVPCDRVWKRLAMRRYRAAKKVLSGVAQPD